MSLSSAKAKLDAQGGDPATGYISKQDHKDSYDQLVADTALTGATTAEAVAVSGTTDASSSTTGSLKTAGGLGVAKKANIGTDLAVGGALTVGTTVNGRDPDNLVAGPASSTDNALVRFDGTDGKTVQNSGITVDDSGFITSNVKVSKATANLTVDATSSYASLTLNSAVNSAGIWWFRSGNSRRWEFAKTSATESGSDAGANFEINRYSDGDALLGLALGINRATGKTTLGSVGATAGLELGASGPRVMSGTGSPEGVVTAPVTSTWTDTVATTGAIQWIKASGTGNTGWVVQYGDTGWRNITSLATANAGQTLAAFMIRRINGVVYLQAQFAQSTTNTVFDLFANGTWPSGFNVPTQTDETVIPGARGGGASYIASNLSLNTNAVSAADVKYRVDNASYMYFNGSWPTADVWPASLPGSAA